MKSRKLFFSAVVAVTRILSEQEEVGGKKGDKKSCTGLMVREVLNYKHNIAQRKSSFKNSISPNEPFIGCSLAWRRNH